MYDAFEEDIAQAQSLLLAGASSELALWIQSYAGIIEIRRGELERGVSILANVADRARRQAPGRVYVFAIQELAYTRGLLQRYDQSLEDLHDAYAVAAALNQPDLIALVNDSYGAVYSYLKDYPRAMEYYSKALAEFERLGYREKAAGVLLGMAINFRDSRQWDEAEAYFNRYLETTSDMPGSDHFYFGNYGLAMTLARRGDCQRALPQIGTALSFEGPEDYDAELYKQQAICLLRRGDVSGGASSLEKARKILATMPELEGTTWTMELDYIDSLLELERGHPREAYRKLDAYHQAAMQQMARSSSDSMNMLRAGLETSRQDLEIALLEQEAEINRLQLESYSRENEGQRAVIIGTAVASLLVLTGLFFQWRSTRRIRELSHRDGLSGLYNRNYTFDYLTKVLPRINVDSGGLSIFLLDVDNFKSINDRYGHPAGDRVIRKIAAIGEESLRNRDIMGRIGGEEFLCVLPRTTAAQSMQVAERLLHAISEETFVTDEGEAFSVSISIGVADYDGTVKDADDLYNRADKALYRAKTAGKGRIATFHAVPPVAAAAAT